MTTNYATEPEAWNHPREDDSLVEKPCPVCRGYQERVDACITCEGYGTVLT